MMRVNVIHVYGLSAEAVQKFKSAFPERKICALNGKADLEDSIADIEVIFVFRPPRGVWSGAKRLRLIQTIGAGVDTVLPSSDLAADVRLTNARGIHGAQMSEHALAMMLAFAKQLPQALANQQIRRWHRYTPGSLAGKTCSILGMGTIGRAVAERAKQFGMRVIGMQREPKPCRHADEVLPPEQIKRALQQADYLVVILPKTPQTIHLLDAKVLADLRPDAILINMARGGIVDETAVADMLREGRLRGAALDVFAEEPLPESSDLWKLPNLIITPHVAGLVPDYLDRVLEIFIDNMRRLEDGKPLRNEIDRARGY
jgi:phosphoglycerate dehydrogenase-like enzyme